eukprot:COSAG02_NODE_27615_length_606_cov_0.706114_1_plen_43_part_10
MPQQAAERPQISIAVPLASPCAAAVASDASKQLKVSGPSLFAA